MINKKFNWSIILFSLSGILISISIYIILINLTMPNYFRYFMSQEMFKLIDISDILPYLSINNALIILFLYSIYIFISTKYIFQNISSNWTTLLLSILIMGLIYPPFYILNSQLYNLDEYSYISTISIIFLILLAILSIIKKITNHKIEYKTILIYSTIYSILIFGFELYLLNFLVDIVEYMDIITNSQEWIRESYLILFIVIIIISILIHTLIAYIMIDKVKYRGVVLIVITILISQSYIYFIDKNSVDSSPKLINNRALILDNNYYIENMDIVWDIDKFREENFKLIDNKSSIIYSTALFNSSQMLPINDKNRKFLEKLSNRDKFYIPDEYAYKLAKSWISFGDEKRAKKFYNSIKNRDDNIYQDWDTLLQKYRFNTGVISGVINGLSKETKVALLQNIDDIDYNENFYNIRDIIITKDKFRFSHLVEGKYKLAILLNNDKYINDVIGIKELNISKNNPIKKINITIIY